MPPVSLFRPLMCQNTTAGGARRFFGTGVLCLSLRSRALALCLSVCLSICLSVCLSVCLSLTLCVCRDSNGAWRVDGRLIDLIVEASCGDGSGSAQHDTEGSLSAQIVSALSPILQRQ